MRRQRVRSRSFLFLVSAFALIAAACGSSTTDTTAAGPPETVIVNVPGETVTVTEIVEVEVPAEGELVTIVARCKANPGTEEGRCNNLLRGIVEVNATLEADGDSRRVQLKIIQDNADWGDYKTEFELASAAGEASDIIVSGHEDIGAWATSGIITDVTNLIPNYPEFDDVVETLWLSTELNGSRWGVPQDAEARPMYFRKDLLAELGWSQDEIDSLPDRVASGEFTMEDMFDTAEAAIAAGVVANGNGWWHRPVNGPDFLYFYYGAGGVTQEAGNDALIFDKAAALKVYELFEDATQTRGIITDTRLDGDWTNWNTGVATGDVLFWFGGSWQWADWAVNYIADRGGEEYLFDNVGFSAIPAQTNGTGNPITLTHPLVYMVSSASEHPDLAMLVIAKATTKELNTEYAVTSGHLGILNAQLTYEPFTSARMLSEVSSILQFTTFLPNSPFFSAWSEAYYLGIQAVSSGDVDAAGALEVVISQLENELGEGVDIRS
ncbi:MAG: extracellular solute-binding protein [Acidobacteria bacterium]|nr:extracellular solute-binding protein [Acidobacteriota bacterium]